MRLIFLIIFCFGFQCLSLNGQYTVDAQKAVSLYRKGEEALLKNKYKTAIQYFKLALKLQPDLVAAERGMGLSYEGLNNWYEARQIYASIIEKAPQFSRLLYYQIGELYYKEGNYRRAISYFEQFERLQGLPLVQFTVNGEKEALLENEILKKLPITFQACRMALDSSHLATQSNVLNVGSAINTNADEYFPFITNDQYLLLYTKRKNENKDEDLYIATSDENREWSNGSPFDNQINTIYNEGMSTLVRDGRTLYFTACNRPGIMGPCDIWTGQVQNGQVREVKAILDHPNSESWESQACISCDGRVLYFSSNRPGGLGGTDIWVSVKQKDGTWSNPSNLGAPINTDKDEESPFISNDGNRLFFSSTGHIGFGGQDIFMSTFDKYRGWSNAFNLGPKINSPFEELGFVLTADGLSGYFASDRPGGFGGMDIYKVNLQSQLRGDLITYVYGSIRDSLTGNPVKANINSTTFPLIQVDNQGRFFLCVPANTSFPLQITHPEYYTQQLVKVIPEWNNRKFYSLPILLVPLKASLPEVEKPAPADTTPPLSSNRFKELKRYYHSLYFQFDSDIMELNEKEKLEAYIAGIPAKSVQRVEINGYADDVGDFKYNLDLSEKRAKVVSLLLLEKGIEISRISLKGHGEIKDDRPKPLNRRVEIKITTLE
ncbi:MAG: PD40 domain-containing protein [Bacteroidetes bacterium]|jgi:outer membrane protein OmpA-like peptidoglycan-associated protein|nr:PD40 domain-containing protein [Bacteroidota bacterium]